MPVRRRKAQVAASELGDLTVAPLDCHLNYQALLRSLAKAYSAELWMSFLTFAYFSFSSLILIIISGLWSLSLQACSVKLFELVD